MYLLVFPNRDYAVGAVSGVMAATVAVFFAHPIEAVKVRIQSEQPGSSPAGFTWHRLVQLLRRPYSGIGPHLLQYSALNFIRFGSFAAAKAYFERQHAEGAPGSQVAPLPLHELFQCGAFSGLCIAAVLHPLWVVKTHQQANRISIAEALCRLWQGEGVRGFFRGYASGFVRFPIALGVFFTSYEALKRPEVLGRAGSGAVAGALCWTSIFPLDVVQSRMMGEATYGNGRIYTSAFTGFARIYRQEGLLGFTRGYSAVLLRSGPVNAVLLPVSDAVQPLAERLLPPSDWQ